MAFDAGVERGVHGVEGGDRGTRVGQQRRHRLAGLIDLRRASGAHAVQQLVVGARQRRLFGGPEARGRFLEHDAFVERSLFQVPAADRPDRARGEEGHLPEVRQQAFLAVLQIEQRVDAA